MFDIWLSSVEGNWLFCPHCVLRSHLCGQISLSIQTGDVRTQPWLRLLASFECWALPMPEMPWCGRVQCMLLLCVVSSHPAGRRGWPAAGGRLVPWHQNSWICSPGYARNPLRSSVVMGCCFFSQVKLHVQRYSQGFYFTSVNKVVLIVLICSSCCDEQQC